jgi:hypothetical protein
LIVSHGAVWSALQEVLKMPSLEITNCQPLRVYKNARGLWQAQIL